MIALDTRKSMYQQLPAPWSPTEAVSSPHPTKPERWRAPSLPDESSSSSSRILTAPTGGMRPTPTLHYYRCASRSQPHRSLLFRELSRCIIDQWPGRSAPYTKALPTKPLKLTVRASGCASGLLDARHGSFTRGHSLAAIYLRQHG